MKVIRLLMIFAAITLLYCCSGENGNNEIAEISYFKPNPDYDSIQLSPTDDTLHFSLDENTYNKVTSFNAFIHSNNLYLSIYDKKTGNINIFDATSTQRVKSIHIDKTLGGDSRSYVTVYCVNFDSIWINNLNTLFIVDSSKKIKRAIKWDKNDYKSEIIMENTGPPVLKDSFIYTGVRPSARFRDLDFLRKWKILFEFDIKQKKERVLYKLPKMYHEHSYGFSYQNYSYCYNDKGNFVLSFPADTNIYETNFNNYHNAYFGKSKEQNQNISPMQELTKSVSDDQEHYKRQFAYGPIYFDSVHKRYLRVAKRPMKDNEIKAKRALIIFDERFRIIGESDFPLDASFNNIFFTPDGKVYARTKLKDEYALHFVRLEYKTKTQGINSLTKK